VLIARIGVRADRVGLTGQLRNGISVHAIVFSTSRTVLTSVWPLRPDQPTNIV